MGDRNARAPGNSRHRPSTAVSVVTARVDQRIVARELAELAASVTAPGVVADPVVSRQLERLVSAVQQLLDEHSLDGKGRCQACGRRRGCPVRSVLKDYAGWWLAAGRMESTPPAAGNAVRQ
jgi:hypothetical protein